MAVTPTTELRLINVGIEIDNKNQVTFPDKQTQTNYFLSKSQFMSNNFTYQRQNNVIRYPAHIDSILHCNYCMYQNENYTDKWFYCYITNMKYINDNMTEITIKTDVYQTWMYELSIRPCFVEREHVNNDSIGAHTIPEDLAVPEVVCEETGTDQGLSQYGYIGILSNWNPESKTQSSGVTIYNSTFFGTLLYLFESPIGVSPEIGSARLRNLQYFILQTTLDGHISDINEIFIIPYNVIEPANLILHQYSVQGNDASFYTTKNSTGAHSWIWQFPKLTRFSDYTPKNNKCFCYPYNYLYVTNNVGNHNIYKYENFSNNQVQLQCELSLSVGMSGRLFPVNYKRMNENIDELVPLAKYPTCAWSSDAYINWLTQNSVNIQTQKMNLGIDAVRTSLKTASSTVDGIGKALTLNVSGALSSVDSTIGNVQSYANEVMNVIGSFYEADLLPNVVQGSNTGNVNFSAGDNTFKYAKMRCKTEYLQSIDAYFSMFGYKVNELKIPNLTGRLNWNYVKTTQANVTGDVPQADLEEFKNMLNNGVTFWHSTNNFLHYELPNNIV